MEYAFFNYWGKAANNEGEFHLLAYHSLEVAAIGWQLLDPEKVFCREMAEFLAIPPQDLRSTLCFLLALHDIGKFSDAFQRLIDFSLYQQMALPSALNYDTKVARHDALGFVFVDNVVAQITAYLTETNDKRDAAKLSAYQALTVRQITNTLSILLNPCLSHHGYPAELVGNQRRRANDYCNKHNQQHVDQFISTLVKLFSPQFPLQWFTDSQFLTRLKQMSWHIAGIAILADWIGSNREFFPYQTESKSLAEYWTIALSQATTALEKTSLFHPFVVAPFISIEHHFGFSPSPLQHWAEQVELSHGPQLFILEDVTGAGKTEAALTLVHRLMADGQADGFFFGLPSMATSNAMYSRLIEYYHSLFQPSEHPPSIVLAHSARQMNQQFAQSIIQDANERDYHISDEATLAVCHRWLADSRKKALLAPVGVGTLDQALLGVLPQKHQALRLIGMYRKVLVFDEIHTADSYMLELIKNLMAVHVRQGGSMILLTATLSQKQRQSLISTWQTALGVSQSTLNQNSFPLATQISCQNVLSQPLASRASVSREVTVCFLHQFKDCVDWVIAQANAGKAVVWVRNTVNDACQAFDAIKDHLTDPQRCVLFHSRFALADRQIAEQRVLKHLGKSSTQQDRQGFVVICTQVFQESLDVDTDQMLSDICPIDDLIQRAGRLHRHTRNQQGQVIQGTDTRHPPHLHIYAPEWTDTPQPNWLQKDFAGTQAVYRSPAKLWLGMKIIRELGAIRMPDQARTLIEAVYGDNIDIPDGLADIDLLAQAEERRKGHLAHNILLNWQQGYSKNSVPVNDWLDESLEITTRYTERDSAVVVICQRQPEGLHPLYSGQYALELSSIKLDKVTYADQLTTVNQTEQLAFLAEYPAAKFKQLWVAQDDPKFGYSQQRGFEERKIDHE